MSQNGNPFEKIPRHIAVIMDGNGRWAQKRGLMRVGGHEAGVQAVREITTECAKLGVETLTLYAFSSENWKRPSYEVSYLMKLLKRFLIDERPELMENRIRLSSIGRIQDLPKDVIETLEETQRITENNRGMNLCLALSYGSRAEMVDAVKKIAQEVKAGRLDPQSIDEKMLRSFFYDPELSDPDLLIRTAGEMRLSNFLLWQVSYTEFYVTPVCWPEFRREHLFEAIASFQSRERKFGGLSPVSV